MLFFKKTQCDERIPSVSADAQDRGRLPIQTSLSKLSKAFRLMWGEHRVTLTRKLSPHCKARHGFVTISAE